MQCPHCESTDIASSGYVNRANRGKVHRYACNNCGKTFIPQEQTKTTETVQEKGQNILMEKRPAIDKINMERAKADKMFLETQKFFENLKLKFWATDEEIEKLVVRLNEHYNPA